MFTELKHIPCDIYIWKVVKVHFEQTFQAKNVTNHHLSKWMVVTMTYKYTIYTIMNDIKPWKTILYKMTYMYILF